ncbi:tetratricopeptide repeat protein [Comamonas testosteroni]|uniref:Tetratricopeptide repeat protein n=1 Tax=Comamonas testosteroni TaxID=285 RepID=A0A373F6D1_COMTE|nr:CDP-glycerol glycerophosphotransferase family protein [Comamonas testosteroni]RGE39714.1 tetratricopeptide repeat protein [Comamonas testosteroni]
MLNYISYINARRLEKNKKWKLALEAYKKISKSQASIPGKLAYRMGFVAEKIQDWKSAETWLDKAVKSNPQKPQWVYRLALAQEKNKKYAAAIVNYKKAIELSPDKVEWVYRSGLCYELLKKYPEAEACYREALQKSPDTAQWHYRLGKVLWLRGQGEQAEEPLRRAMELEPQNATYAHELSVAIRKQGRTWQEVEALQHTLSLDPSEAQWQFEQGDAQDKMNRFVEAAKAFQKANAIKPGNAIWHYREGYAWERAGKRKLTESAYALARRHDKDLKANLFGIGVFHQHRGLWPQAATAYENETKLQPFNGELLYRLGLAHDRCYRWEKAANCYKKALVMEPSKPDWHYRLGFVLERQGLLKQAAQAYEYAATTRATHTPYWFYRLGYVLAGASDYEKACTAFLHTRKDAELTHENVSLPEAQTSLSNDYMESLKENLRSLQQSDSALRSTDQATSFYKLGNQAERLKMWEEAALAYRSAVLRSSVHNSLWYYRLGYVLMQIGNFEEAASAFCETRIFTRAHGVDMSGYEKDVGLMQVIEYVEYLETLSVEPKTVLYESYAGTSISCNPFAIYKSIVDEPRFEGWTHVWVLDDLSRIPEACVGRTNVIFVTRDTQRYRRYLATASWLINNSTFPSYFIRRDEQRYLNTWHGTPLKTLGRDMKGRLLEHKNGARNFLQSTHLLSPNAHTSMVMLQSFDISQLYGGQFMEGGYPRADATVSVSAECRKELLRILQLDSNRPIVLYAPTWRGTHGDIGFDTERLQKDLAALQAEGHQVLFRGHSLAENIIREKAPGITLIPGDIDTNILLSVVDVLITDYSSIFFEFISLNRPIIYYAYDQDEYLVDRGMYFDLADMPGQVCTTLNELLSCLRDPQDWLQQSVMQKKYDAAQKKFCSYDDGNATQRAVDWFFHGQLKTEFPSSFPLKDPANTILMFCGPFMGNGITSAAINLCKLANSHGVPITLVVDPNGINGFDDRIQRLGCLSSDVQILGRVGRLAYTAEDKWLLDQYAGGKISYEVIRNTMQKLYRREFVRCFGSAAFRAVINFEGYSRFWVELFSCGADGMRKAIYQHNDMYEEYTIKYPYLKAVFSSYQNYDAIVSVSPRMCEENAKKLGEKFDIDVNKFTSAINPLDTQNINIKAQENLDKDISDWIGMGAGPLFLNIGRLSPEKRHDKLIEAFDLYRQRGGSGRLLIVGDGPLRQNIAAQVAASEFTSDIFLAGHRMNPYPLFMSADYFILSSDHEGQPVTLLEALQLDLPAIATDIPSNRYVLDGGLGILVENSVEGLIQGMKLAEGKNIFERNSFNVHAYQDSAWENFLYLL